MKINCPGCQAAFSISEAKIPSGKKFKITCPRCKTSIEVPDEDAPPFVENKSAARTRNPGDELEEQMSDPAGYDVAEEGKFPALLCVAEPKSRSVLQRALEEIGYQVFTAPSAAAALNKMQANSYELILMDEKFGGVGDSEDLLLRHFQLLPMHLRRRFLLCYLSESLPSMDRLVAFRVGVDIILNLKDIEKARALLERAIKERAGFYRVFRGELEKRGQF